MLPAELFLALVERSPGLQAALARPSLEELYGVLESSPEPALPSRMSLLNLAAHQLAERTDQLDVLSLPPGEQAVPQGTGSLLVSSSNVEGQPPGSEVQAGQRLRVLGKLPARLISRPVPWPPVSLAMALVVGRDGDGLGDAPGELLEPESGLIQGLSQAPWSGLSAWVEVGGIAPCPCPKPLLPPRIST
jgi:hypothetical protein